MKISIKLLIFMSIGILSFSACTKEDLAKYPDDQIQPELAFGTINDITYWSNGFYTYLRSRSYGVYNYTDIQADFVLASGNYGNNQGGVHRWDFTSDDYTIRDVWANYYSAIANINYFLTEIDEQFTPNGDTEIATVNRTKAEAYFMRAYYYHKLVLHYAKDYEPASAASDLGVPLVETQDISLKPARATLKETYDFIMADLTKAKSLMPTTAVTKYRVGHDAIDALRARVSLDMHKYQDAVDITDALLTKYAYVSSAAEHKSMWLNDANTSEVIFRVSAKLNAENPTTSSLYLVSSTWHTGASIVYFAPYYYPTLRALNYYEKGDWRFDAYFGQQYVNQGGSLKGAYIVSKYIGNPALYTDSRLPNYRHMQLIFRSSEMGMINAEANYRLGNEAAALTAVNNLRVARGVAEIDESGADLFEAIKVERTREMMYEGTRIFDLKRWNDPMPVRGPAHTTYVQTGANFDQLTKPAGDNKFVWAIPRNDETINKNIVQNPGW